MEPCTPRGEHTFRSSASVSGPCGERRGGQHGSGSRGSSGKGRGGQHGRGSTGRAVADRGLQIIGGKPDGSQDTRQPSALRGLGDCGCLRGLEDQGSLRGALAASGPCFLRLDPPEVPEGYCSSV